MQSRTIREGSVGLLILLGVGFLGLLVMWLRGFNPGARSYRILADFADVGGMQVGAPVRYRGVSVGKVTDIQPSANGVEVAMEISPATLLIPEDALIQVNQSGLIGETSIDITPQEGSQLPAVSTNPIAPDCQQSSILCDGDRVPGEVGVSFGELIKATVELSELFGDEAFFGELRALARNTSDAAAGVAILSREVTRLTRSVERELTSLSNSAEKTTVSVGRTADQLTLTAAQVNVLLSENRAALAGTLENINQTTNQIRLLTTEVTPLMENGEFVRNLQTLSANAAAASANLRALTDGVGNPENVVLLQQTLESARATFQNVQKITSDLDELTGDPAFRDNVRNLVNGLGNLLSYTDQLEQQTQMAQALATAQTSLEQPPASTATAEVPMTTVAPLVIPTLQPPVRLTLLDPEYEIRMNPFRQSDLLRSPTE
jgi:phospholipid/cholesterol/gamma-HCH transport system substrate-binding protein